MIRKLKYVFLIIIVFYACSQVKYSTIYQGFYDPAYDLKNKKICFLPWYWTEWGKENNINQLIEKTIYYHFKREFEKRGLSTEYIEPEDLIYDKEKNIIWIKEGTTYYCDCTLSTYYSQNVGTVKFPARSSSNFWLGETRGGGGSSYVSSYDVTYYNLHISGGLWTGKASLKKIWQGSITKGSPTPNLDEQAKKMVKKLFRKKFPKIK